MAVLQSENWLRDIKFNLKEFLNVESLLAYDAYSDFSWDDFDMMIDEARNISQELLNPLHKKSEKIGLKLENGKTIVPEAYKEAWQTFCEAGWSSMPLNADYGGGGMPYVVANACTEFIHAVNPVISLYVGLTGGSGRLIESFASDKLKQLFLEKMYTGEWTGSMGLTEPQAGSDLNLVRTKAVDNKDGTYNITGSKIFISCGDHNIADNIIHLVLAKMEGAAEGTAGISLFAVPKIWVTDDGSLAADNNVATIALEHKLGLHSSPTCALQFDNSRAYMVGKESYGLPQMFQLMNEARMMVGLLSLANSAQAYDHALAYAKDRVQGAKITDRKSGAVRIIEHEDIRRMLMTMKASTEGIRALIYKGSMYFDIAEHETETEKREEAEDLLALFVPLCKAYASDRSWELDRDAIQVFGGYGFTTEYPVAELAAETKINSIWEGTNYIQSMDLVGRKISMKNGKVIQDFVSDILSFCSKNEAHKNLANSFALLKKGAELLAKTLMQYGAWANAGKLNKLAWTSTRFLDSISEVIIAKLLLEQAIFCEKKLEENTVKSEDLDFYKSKRITANFFASNILPQAFSRFQIILKGDDESCTMNEAMF
jgi:alkylation response protein AidB-like acyl-CoA dehydrogenase